MNKYLSGLVVSIVWVFIIGSLPFIEEFLYPSNDTNDDWQRGLVSLPLLIIFLWPISHAVFSKVMENGMVSFKSYVYRVAVKMAQVSISISLIFSAILFFSNAIDIYELGLAVLYFSFIFIVTGLIPAVIFRFIFRIEP